MANKDNIDEILKGKLEGLSYDFDPSHWEMFQDRLAMEGLTNEVDAEADVFDNAIKGKLEEVDMSFNPLHWEMMKSSMEAEGMEVTPDPVDEIIKTRLENIQYDYNPSHWSLLQKRIDADAKQVEDVLFDASTYGHLSNVEIPYNEEHWQLMKERIDAEFSIRGRMVRFKVAEIALILMIIISMFHYLPLNKKSIKQQEAIASSTTTDTNAATTQQKEIADVATPVTKKNAAIETPSETTNPSNSVSNTEIKTELNNSSSEEPSIAVANISTPTPPTSVDANQSVSDANESNHNSTIAIAMQTMDEDKAINNPSLIDAMIEVEAMAQLEEQHKMELMPEVEAVETLQASLLDIEEDADRKAIGCASCTGLTQKWGLSIGMVSAFDLNHVMTPYDDIFNENAYNQTVFGYGGGFTVGYRYNRWEVETGALYSSKQYAPKPRIEIFSGNAAIGYVGESIDDVELNMIKVPLNVKYHFKNTGKWNFYTNGGAILNMAMQANYDRKQHFFGGQIAGGGLFPGFPVAEQSETAKKGFEDGIVEGGSFIENRYFTANLGIGVERKFSPRWSIFSQPTYQHQLLSSGLGPNKDRINTFSILTGARVTF